MPIKARPIGKTFSRDIESDVVEVTYSHSTGLRIIIDTGTDRFSPLIVEVTFPSVNGFRYLDEGDLIRYWESNEFKGGHHIYEILDGGWINGETLDPGLLSVSSSVGQREWFVATTNYCVTIIGCTEPLIREFSGRK